MQYTDENRGKYQYIKRAKQLVEFEGLKYGNGTPTDVDGLIEWRDKAFIFFELKYRDAKLPTGQRKALERLVDDLAKAGKQAVLFVASHNVDDTSQAVKAANATVTGVYYNRGWRSAGGSSLKDMVDRFLRFTERK